MYKRPSSTSLTNFIHSFLKAPTNTIIADDLNAKYCAWNRFQNNSLGITLSQYDNATEIKIRNRGMLFPLLNKTRPILIKNRHNSLKVYVSSILIYARSSGLLSLTFQWREIELSKLSA